jgi:5'(3')-deoxyribonucleotidase
MKIFLDMDGVVADFNLYARSKIQPLQSPKIMEDVWEPVEWKKIKTIPHLYRNLPKTAFADTIVNIARNFRDELNWGLYMLTAIPKNNDVPDVFQDKIEWMQEYYPDIPVRFGPYSYDKKYHAQPGYILVDDRTSNCQEWQQYGGTSIQVTSNYNLAIEQLETEYKNALKNYRAL